MLCSLIPDSATRRGGDAANGVFAAPHSPRCMGTQPRMVESYSRSRNKVRVPARTDGCFEGEMDAKQCGHHIPLVYRRDGMATSFISAAVR